MAVNSTEFLRDIAPIIEEIGYSLLTLLYTGSTDSQSHEHRNSTDTNFLYLYKLNLLYLSVRKFSINAYLNMSNPGRSHFWLISLFYLFHSVFLIRYKSEVNAMKHL